MADVFVSYKAEDRKRVQPLVQALQADGFSVWWDAQIGGGANWQKDIEEHLEAAKCVIVVWSKRSIGEDGHFVRDEARRAQQRHVYIPVTIDKVKLPLGFGETQAIALNGWTSDRSDPRYQSVLEAIRSLVSGTPHHGRVQIAAPIVSRRLMLGGTAVAAAAIAGGWFVFRPKAVQASNRIAVLPFANLSGDPAEAYFSDGIAEELRSSLSRVGMQVIGRTSSDAVRNLDAKSAAAKLGVANILTGSVRRSPQTIRIDAQLVSGSDGVERWSEAYDRPTGDVLKVQTDIAENVASALSIALGQAGRAALTLGGTNNPAAQDLVLKAIHDPVDSEAGVERKLALLDAALSLDPHYAEAYARKANWQSWQGGFYATTAEAARRDQAEALATANHALAISPNMALGYAVRAAVYQARLQIGLALIEAKRAVALSDENAAALDSYASLLELIGRFEEALQLNAKAISLDPLSPDPYSTRANILYWARRYSESATSAKRSLAIEPDQTRTRGFLGLALLAQGETVEAQSEFEKLDPFEYRRLLGEAVIAARAGRRLVALDKLNVQKSRYGDANHYQYGEIYAQLGQKEDAFNELDLAWKLRDPGLAFLRGDPFFDPLRRDPRFEALERKIGLI